MPVSAIWLPVSAIWHSSERDLCHYLDTGTVWLKLPKVHPPPNPVSSKLAFYTVTRLQSQSFVGGIKYIHDMRMNIIKTLQPQFHIRMQQISCDTALVRTMGYIGSYIGSVVLEACGPRAYVTAMWHSCMCHNLHVSIQPYYN